MKKGQSPGKRFDEKSAKEEQQAANLEALGVEIKRTLGTLPPMDFTTQDEPGAENNDPVKEAKAEDQTKYVLSMTKGQRLAYLRAQLKQMKEKSGESPK